MKVFQVAPVLPPRGGMGTVAHRYAEDAREAGFDVKLFSPSYGMYSGGDVEWLRGVFSYGNAAVVPSLLWQLREADVIHLHYPFYGSAIFTAMASLIWRKPMVLTYHMRTRGTGWLGMLFWLHKAILEPFILRRARMVLVSSLDYAESIDLKHPRLVELPFGVDVERFSPGETQALREKLRIASSECVFLFVGGMDDAHYFKGVPIFLKALARLPNLHLLRVVLVGDGNRRKDFENLASTLGLRDRLIFAGKVSPEELPDYYRLADVHVLPSTDRSEAFGLVTLEAAASGLPSIVTNLPGVRTLVENDRTGFVVSPEDVSGLESAIRAFLDTPARAEAMGVRARERVERLYSQQVIARKLQDVYEQVRVELYEDRDNQ